MMDQRQLQRDPIEDDDVKEAVVLGYHKLLSYKDEYEVARLLTDTRKKAEERFEGDLKLTYLLAPPLFARKGANGRPAKIGFGQAMARTFPALAVEPTHAGLNHPVG